MSTLPTEPKSIKPLSLLEHFVGEKEAPRVRAEIERQQKQEVREWCADAARRDRAAAEATDTQGLRRDLRRLEQQIEQLQSIIRRQQQDRQDLVELVQEEVRRILVDDLPEAVAVILQSRAHEASRNGTSAIHR